MNIGFREREFADTRFDHSYTAGRLASAGPCNKWKKGKEVET